MFNELVQKVNEIINADNILDLRKKNQEPIGRSTFIRHSPLKSSRNGGPDSIVFLFKLLDTLAYSLSNLIICRASMTAIGIVLNAIQPINLMASSTPIISLMLPIIGGATAAAPITKV